MTNSIEFWQKESHRLAIEKGFHSRECTECASMRPEGYALECFVCNGTGRIPVDPNSPTRIGARLAAIHAEISEAYECVARGRMELYWADPLWPGTDVCDPDLSDDPSPSTWSRERLIAGGWKPEGFPIELADVFLRTCDLAESLDLALTACEPELSDEFDRHSPEHCASALNQLHNTVSNLNVFNVEQRYLQLVLQDLVSIAHATGVDLLAMAELKHEYNKTRPVRHGKVL